MKKLHEQKKIINPEIYDKVILAKQKAPDPKKHQLVSFVKSAIRILGYCTIPYNLSIAAGILILSEAIGIIEELV